MENSLKYLLIKEIFSGELLTLCDMVYDISTYHIFVIVIRLLSGTIDIGIHKIIT